MPPNPKRLTQRSLTLSASPTSPGGKLALSPSASALNEGAHGYVKMSVYLLATMKLLKECRLADSFVPELTTTLQFVSFGPQVHLLASDFKNREIISHVVQITTQQNVCQVVTDHKEETVTHPDDKPPSNAYLDYFYHVFDKFCVKSQLQTERRPFSLNILVDLPPKVFQSKQYRSLCTQYIRDMFVRLQEETRKNMDDLKTTTNVIPFCDFSRKLLQWQSARLLGDWVRDVICLVPLQVARAEGNNFRPLCDGLQMSQDTQRQDVLGIAANIRFGLYESVLESCTTPVRVVSSMGKQSTGKSYLLNHLAGSLFDISGGRCTDGVWLTVRPTPECMYVVLDFEGLGSFERSEQEDMLLSVFNAAISNLTLYKTDFRIDKDTAATFARFQSGVSLIKGDDKLFQGRFYIIVKDVDSRDVKDLQAEFLSKITAICRSNDSDNFLSKMYKGQFAMSTFPPLGNRQFYEHLRKVYQALVKQPTAFETGRVFKNQMQLLMAKISMKDWTPLDRTQIALRVDLVRRNLGRAINRGCLADSDEEGSDAVPLLAVVEADLLKSFDTGEAVLDTPLPLTPLRPGDELTESEKLVLVDTGLLLRRGDMSDVELMAPLRHYFERHVLPRTHANFKEWHSRFQQFLDVIVERRKTRVQAWVDLNVKEFPLDGDVQMLKHEVTTELTNLSRIWTLCGLKCDRCYYACLLSKYHAADHSCVGAHKCEESCSYCLADRDKYSDTMSEFSDTMSVSGLDSPDFDRPHPEVKCGDLAGHAGQHDCRAGSHTCGQTCHLSHLNNCNHICAQRPGHEGPHVCNALTHLCGAPCSLDSCNNSCIIPYEKQHTRHVCHESKCPHRCPMPDCTNPCASDDHFHGYDQTGVQHLCGRSHPCTHQCEHAGVCEITSQLIRERRTFRGTRGDFDYDFVTEQNSVRRRCSRMVPPFALTHDGLHSHTDDPKVAHYCDAKCPACGYVCNLPWAHAEPLHKTEHGNMRNCFFVAEDESIDVGQRKYAQGESGEAEMCGQYCRTLGRGHIHLAYCAFGSADACCVSKEEGRRHETCKYGPDEDKAKDELTHSSYWKSLGFADPCTAEEQVDFACCPYECGADEHQARPGMSPQDIPEPSYCTLKLWHEPLDPKGKVPGNIGFISHTGHHFACVHSNTASYHTYFIVDRSASMAISDAKPTLNFVKKRFDGRLGAVYESCHRFIMTRKGANAVEDRVSMLVFNDRVQVVFANETLNDKLVHRMLEYGPMGNTNFSAALKQAGELLARYRSSKHRPLFVFLTDGTEGTTEASSPSLKLMEQLLRREAAFEHRLVMHTIKFGGDVEGNDLLQQLASASGGTFSISLDEVQLIETFENISGNLKLARGGLIRR
mmetsp:Transcript_22245/g.37245  ORF Transcript_22245/g.37245 Transcript_22245/m.37245 type:complete len:1360 (-) Transcript_22245:841-4920(-)